MHAETVTSIFESEIQGKTYFQTPLLSLAEYMLQTWFYYLIDYNMIEVKELKKSIQKCSYDVWP